MDNMKFRNTKCGLQKESMAELEEIKNTKKIPVMGDKSTKIYPTSPGGHKRKAANEAIYI